MQYDVVLFSRSCPIVQAWWMRGHQKQKARKGVSPPRDETVAGYMREASRRAIRLWPPCGTRVGLPQTNIPTYHTPSCRGLNSREGMPGTQ